MSTALLFEDGTDAGNGVPFERVDLRQGAGASEPRIEESSVRDWIFGNPGCIPMNSIRPGAGDLVAVCREFPLRKSGSSVRIDMFGVTRHGHPVLVECKLWRNPQARREVIAQILEYAALLRRLSYSDLTATLKGQTDFADSLANRHGLSSKSPNPLYDLVAKISSGASEETGFTDTVASCLKRGEIELIVAGDGIREDTEAIAEHLRDHGARLTLLELQVWKDSSNRLLLVPHIPFRTEVQRQRVLVDETGRPLSVEEPHDDRTTPTSEAGNETRAANRIFWDRFIEEVRFDHPDQSQPTHGGQNYVRIKLPYPGRWITAWRSVKGEMGFFLAQMENSNLESLVDEAEAIRKETGLDELTICAGEEPGIATVEITVPAPTDDDKKLEWLVDVANRLVNAIRPRLTHLDSN